jgi:nitrogen fixation/metabolism regulation signal transduction histidine kinase
MTEFQALIVLLLSGLLIETSRIARSNAEDQLGLKSRSAPLLYLVVIVPAVIIALDAIVPSLYSQALTIIQTIRDR